MFVFAFVGTVFAMLSTLTVHAQRDAGIPFPWVPKSSAMSLTDAFGTNHSSFDIAQNWGICNAFYVDVSLNSTVSDYSPVINSALRFLNRTGGSVRLESGTYHLSSPVDLPSRTCIIGQGMERTYLKLTARALPFADTGMLKASKGEHVSLMNLTIDGNRMMLDPSEGFGRSGVYIELVNYIWCRNVRVRNNARHGFYPHGSDGRLLYHAFFEGCVAEGNGRDGFKVSETSYASVFNSISQRNGRNGVSISGSAMHSLVESNNIFNNGLRTQSCGISVSSDGNRMPSETYLKGNSIVNASFAGVCLNNTNDVVVVGNSISSAFGGDTYCYNLTNVRRFSEVESLCLSKTKFYPGLNVPSRSQSSSPTTTPSPTVSPTSSATSSSSATPSATATSIISPTPSTSASATSSAKPSPSSTTSSTPSSEPTTKPSFSLSPSPSPLYSSIATGCMEGIALLDVCCPLDCKVCGDESCTHHLQYNACCPNAIRNSGISCLEFGPPCLLRRS